MGRTVSILVFLGLMAVGGEPPSRTVPVLTPTELWQRLQRSGDTLVVVNFWATWCRPCLEELPAFDSLARRYRGTVLRVWLVNVDFRSQWERVRSFVARRGFTAPVFLLAYGRGDRWMDTLHPEWSGSLPATLFWRASDSVRALFEGELSFDELERYVQQYLGHR